MSDHHDLAQKLIPFLQDGLMHRSKDTYHYDRLIELAASLDSANFAATHFTSAQRYETDEALLRAAVKNARPGGLFLEFGVASGRTINVIADAHPGPVFGFDSFNGLPENWRPGYPAGRFAQTPPVVHPNVELMIGYFDKTLPDFIAEHQMPVSLLHVDCDLYSSTKTILECLKSCIVPGTIIIFDEFLNYPGWREHEFKAWDEFVRQQGLNFKYTGCVPSHQQVCALVS